MFFSFPSGFYQSGFAQLTQVGAGQLHADGRIARQHVDCFFILTQQFDELQSFRTGHCLADSCYLLIKQIFDFSSIIHVFEFSKMRILCQSEKILTDFLLNGLII